jgi:hypothetical protein
MKRTTHMVQYRTSWKVPKGRRPAPPRLIDPINLKDWRRWVRRADTTTRGDQC